MGRFQTLEPRSYSFVRRCRGNYIAALNTVASASLSGETQIDMHELSIMQSALTLALAEAQKAGATRVHVIRLRVGALSGVVPEALTYAFEALSQGTLAEGGQLAIDPVPARFWCEPCAREFVAEDLWVVCPACGGSKAELRSGRELEIASLEVD